MGKVRLTEYETVVIAWAEYCSGPGWANKIIWVIVRNGDGKLRMESIQPEQQTVGMETLFQTSAVNANAMTKEVRKEWER